MEHECWNLKKERMRVGTLDIYKYTGGWSLTIQSLDDTYIYSQTKIIFCPFCGVKLNE